MTGFDIVGMLLMLVTPVLLVVTFIRGLKRKSHKALGVVTIVCCVSCLVCAYLAPPAPVKEAEEVKVEVSEDTPAVEEVESPVIEDTTPVVETPAPAEAIEEATPSPEEEQSPQEEGNFPETVETVPDLDPILVELGLLEVYPFDTRENGKMVIERARIYDSEDMQLNLTYEDGKLIYVQLTNIMYDAGSLWSNRTDKLKTTGSDFLVPDVEMYNDTDGVLAVLDWEARTIKRAE
jgi:hypothetical protein